jgi:rhodanese-related sulfurtransferase
VREGGRVLRQALALGALGVLIAAAVHFPLVRRFARGEFRDSFIQASEVPGVRLITVEEGEELWRTGVAALVDARPPSVYAQGHVPGALSVPASGQEKPPASVIPSLSREGVLVVYCEGGDCQSSLLLAKRLSAEGFKDIRVMTGGWEAWLAAGLPAETGPPREKTDDPE